MNSPLHQIKPILKTALFVLMGTGLNIALCQTNPRPLFYDVHVGGGLPRSPMQFLDFWGPGVDVGGGIGFPVLAKSRILAQADYRFFPLDKDRFLKGLQTAPNSQNSVSGAGTSILTVSGQLKYVFEAEFVPQIYPIAGVGVSGVFVGSGTGTYSGFTVNQKVESRFAISAMGGFGIQWHLAEIVDLYSELKYFYAVTRRETINSDFISLTVGIQGYLIDW